MFAKKHYPSILLPKDLDTFLEKGWYRMGQSVFTTHFLSFHKKFYSALWLRLSLEGYEFKKRLRKLKRSNDSLFRTVFRKSYLDEEKEALFQLYRKSFKGNLAPNLKVSLLDGEDYNIFKTYELCIYHGDQLIAFSFFDLGKTSAASILGVYHPEYSRYSLGFYTMLLEIQYCMEQDMTHYYPGYVVPGYPRFDYKARIGEVDYFDLKQEEWLPYRDLKKEDIPLYKMESTLGKLQSKLNNSGVQSKLLYYPLFEANLLQFWPTNYLDHPVFLALEPLKKSKASRIAVYDVKKNAIQVMEVSLEADAIFYFRETFSREDKKRFFLELIDVEKKLFLLEDEEDVSRIVDRS